MSTCLPALLPSEPSACSTKDEDAYKEIGSSPVSESLCSGCPDLLEWFGIEELSFPVAVRGPSAVAKCAVGSPDGAGAKGPPLAPLRRALKVCSARSEASQQGCCSLCSAEQVPGALVHATVKQSRLRRDLHPGRALMPNPHLPSHPGREPKRI